MIYKKRITIISIIFMIFLQIYLTTKLGSSYGYYVYFSVQDAGRAILYIFSMIAVIPSFILIYYYQEERTNHDSWIVQRIGYKEGIL